MLKHRFITLGLIFVFLISASSVVGAQMPSTVTTLSVQDCQDGLLATISGTVNPEEVLIVSWSFNDEFRGFATHQVALTDITGERFEIVLPHPGLHEGDITNFGTVVVSPENLSLAFVMMMSVFMSGQPPTATTLDTLSTIMSMSNENITVEDCSIGDAAPTVSNYNFEDFDWSILLENIMQFFQPFIGEIGQ